MQISQLFLPEISQAIEVGDLESLRAVFEDLNPIDVAELVNHLSSDRVANIIRLLRFPKGIGVFEYLDVQTQAKVINHLGRAEIVSILEELSADDRVDLIRELPDEAVNSLLPFVAQAEREDIRKLLQYGDNTAGSIMTTEYAHLPAHITVETSLNSLRTVAPDAETIYYVYITDPERRLLGIISLRELVLARPQSVVKDIMSKDPISVSVDTDQEDVVRMFKKYDFIAVPVVDADMRLVGIVTHDDALDIAVAEQTEDVHRMGAVEPLEDPYFQSTFFHMARKRSSWLLLLFVGQFFTFSALSHFQDVLEQTILLMFFVPLIIASGGNSGSQSVTLITRGLALGEVKIRDSLKVMLREGAMGLTLGLTLCVVGIIWARLIWSSPWNICIAVGVSLIGVVTFGSVLGAILPLLFKRMGFDPALMSTPFVASIVDVCGIVIYFSVAQLILQL